MSDLVSQYLNEIGLVPLLDAQKERELSQAIENGRVASEQKEEALAAVPKNAEPDQMPPKSQMRSWDRTMNEAARAKEHFIRANLRLVVSVARRYPLPPGMELLDLIQEGNLGLEHAVDKFDWRKGFKFSTYATFWIRQAIGRALDQRANLVRLPGDRAAALRAALRESSGDSSDLDVENAMLHRLTTPAALDRTVGDDGTTELLDLLADAAVGPEERVVEYDHSEQLFSIVRDELDERSCEAIELRLGLFDGKKRSYREVGEELGVTAEAARRLVKRSLAALKKRIPADLLENFPELMSEAEGELENDGLRLDRSPTSTVREVA